MIYFFVPLAPFRRLTAFSSISLTLGVVSELVCSPLFKDGVCQLVGRSYGGTALDAVLFD